MSPEQFDSLISPRVTGIGGRALARWTFAPDVRFPSPSITTRASPPPSTARTHRVACASNRLAHRYGFRMPGRRSQPARRPGVHRAGFRRSVHEGTRPAHQGSSSRPQDLVVGERGHAPLCSRLVLAHDGRVRQALVGARFCDVRVAMVPCPDRSAHQPGPPNLPRVPDQTNPTDPPTSPARPACPACPTSPRLPAPPTYGSTHEPLPCVSSSPTNTARPLDD